MASSLILRANNGAPLTWDQMDNNLLYLQSVAKGQTLDDVLTNDNTSAQSIVLSDGTQSTTVSPGGFVYTDLSAAAGGTLTLVGDILTTNYKQVFQSKSGTVALLSDVASGVVGGIATASVNGGAGQKIQIRHTLGYTPSMAVVTPINASSSLLPYYVSYTELTDTNITIRYSTTIAPTLVGYSYIVK